MAGELEQVQAHIAHILKGMCALCVRQRNLFPAVRFVRFVRFVRLPGSKKSAAANVTR